MFGANWVKIGSVVLSARDCKRHTFVWLKVPQNGYLPIKLQIEFLYDHYNTFFRKKAFKDHNLVSIRK